MDTEKHIDGAIKTDLSFVPDVKSLINWLRFNISDMENLRDKNQHVLDSDDEFTLLTCKIALQSISKLVAIDNLTDANL